MSSLVLLWALAQVEPATLILEVNVAGATVTVDGQSVGVSPLPPLQLAPGPHILTAQKKGYDTWAAREILPPTGHHVVQAVLIPHVVAPMEPGMDLARKDDFPVITRWWFWGLVAAAAVGLVTTGILVTRGPAPAP